MNIFSEIEGLKGENFTTAVLRYLLLQSQNLREVFIGLISEKSNLGPILLSSHFACLREYPTREIENDSKGRVDLLIETDDFVIGIENKIFADFQTKQPYKYMETLENYAKKLSNLRSESLGALGQLKHLIVVIAPKSRNEDVNKMIEGGDESQKNRLLYVTWEDVMVKFEEQLEGLDRKSELILSVFIDFLRDRLAFVTNFPAIYPHLRNCFENKGSALQREFISKLWQFFPSPGPRMAPTSTYVGYNFWPNNSQNLWNGWYGFVSEGEILEKYRKYATELIVSTAFDLHLDKKNEFRKIKLKGSWYLGEKKEPIAWAVEFDETWDRPEEWLKALAPIKEAADKIESELG